MPPGTFIHDWGLPGINIRPPPFATATDPASSPLRGKILNLARSDYTTFGANHRKQFLAADVAWFAGGASTDGNHIPAPDSYFHEFDDLRQMLPTGTIGNEARRALHERMQHVVFDLATLWDRAFGGSTMIMHIEGTTVPNTPVHPQFLRCAAYLPPSFVANNPASHGPIARIVQTFIEAVGVPTVNKWRSNGNRRGWPLNQPGPGAHPNPASTTLIPQPSSPASAHYKFHGRPIGVLDEILAASAPVPVVVIPDDDEDIFDSSGDDILTVLERLGYAEAESRDRLTRIHDLEEQTEMLMSQVAALETALATERQSNTALRSALTLPTLSSPPHSRTSTGTPPYSPSPIPLRLMSPLAASAASPSRHAYDQVDLDTFITSHGLDNHAASIRMVMRAFHAAKWSEELVQLGIPDEILSTLLEVMSACREHTYFTTYTRSYPMYRTYDFL
ncbi:hypothetical protein B0H10DRAFT_2242738 [Mycena sp. CBHHK59/15]|nr:hypothetical protein B0H10DRAFT_2242738 [Mycena sp. CBHHK59/15]